MGYRSSGNLTVDAMGSIAISGNVIPEEWYKHMKSRWIHMMFLKQAKGIEAEWNTGQCRSAITQI